MVAVKCVSFIISKLRLAARNVRPGSWLTGAENVSSLDKNCGKVQLQEVAILSSPNWLRIKTAV